MAEEAFWLDGNALAGVLDELLGVEATTAPRRCRSCGALSVLAAHRLYVGAGSVLRCPACGDVALCLVRTADGYVLHLSGTWRLEIADGGARPGPSAPGEPAWS